MVFISKEIQLAAKTLSGLSHERRLAIYLLIINKGKNGLSPRDILKIISIPPQTLSFHLKELRQSNLILQKREGTILTYTPNFVTLKKLRGFFVLLNNSENHNFNKLRKFVSKEFTRKS